MALTIEFSHHLSLQQSQVDGLEYSFISTQAIDDI